MTIIVSKQKSDAPAERDPLDPERVADIDDVEDDGYGGELVPFEEPDPWAPSPLRAPLERFANRPLPTWYGVRASTRWWTWALSQASLRFLAYSPLLGLYQIRYICRGIGKWATIYATWRAKPEWRAAAAEAEGKDRAKYVTQVEKAKSNASKLTIVLIVLAIVGTILALRWGYGLYVLAALILIAVLADIHGRKGAPVSNAVAVMPRSSFREGMPSHVVVQDVKAVLIEQGHDEETTAVVEPRVGPYGMSMQVHSRRALSEHDPAAIERGLQTYRGAVQVLAEPGNAAVSELRIWWTDPLATTQTPPHLPPLSGSIAEPAELGYGVGGVPLLLNFMRTNLFIVGGPGSGKSSTLWTCIDWLSTRHDVVLHGIDLSGGPALRSWGDVFATRAFDAETAKKLLEKRIRSAIERTNLLAERSEPRPGMPAPKSENWTPQDAAEGRGLFHILVIDELPLMANDPDLIALYGEYLRIGRKAGETSIAAAQDMTKETLGLTSIRKYPSTLIMHACSREDVTQALGGGKVQEGWAPHRLVPAEGDNENDAGKAYIKSGRHTTPIPWRFNRLDDLAEIHRRAMERIEAGRPIDGAERDVAAEVTPIPPVLGALVAAFRGAGEPEFMRTEDVLGQVNEITGEGLTAAQLAAALKPYGVIPARKRVDGEPARGYFWAAVSEAVEGL